MIVHSIGAKRDDDAFAAEMFALLDAQDEAEKLSSLPTDLKTLEASAKIVLAATPKTFAVDDIKALPIIVDPFGRLETVTAELRGHRDYRLVREEYCQLSILLNLQGRMAPAFRPQPKVGKTPGTRIYFEIHRDQLVIDCHWLHCKKERVRASNLDYRPIFDPKYMFSFDLAWKFATQEWKTTHRTDEVLLLTTRQQCQLATLKGKNLKERWNLAKNGIREKNIRIPAKIAAVRQQLNEWAERKSVVVPLLQDYEDLWLARELLGASGSIKQITELFALVSGKRQLDEKTVRDKLKTMDRHIGGVR